MKLEITPELEQAIAEQTVKAIREAYYGTVQSAIQKGIIDRLTEDGTLKRIIDGVCDRIVLGEQEYIDKIGADIKSALLTVTGTIAKATLDAVEKRIKDYGFIKIGDR